MRVIKKSGILFYFALCPGNPPQSSARLLGIALIFHSKQKAKQSDKQTQRMLNVYVYDCFYNKSGYFQDTRGNLDQAPCQEP